jgi:pimeloyl-ACP methyl ester carboxylesterase
MKKPILHVSAALLALVSLVANGTEGFFDSNGVRIRYFDEGQGTPIVLVHGQGVFIENTWIDTGIFESLKKDYRVVALDLRGHGKSGKPHDAAAYGNDLALDVIRLMDHLGIRKAHIVGYSLGGFVTSQLLTTHPDRFATATLVAAGARTQYSEENRARDELEADERERECISRSFSLRLAPPDAPKPTEEDWRKRSEQCKANPSMDQRAMAAIVRSRKLQVVSPEDVAKTRVPTLAIVGTADPLQSAVKGLQKLRPDIKIVYIQGAVHAPGPANATLRHPETLQAMRGFLASQ